jgi:phosphomethylpyrimidine synthase
MAKARKKRDWQNQIKLSVNPEEASKIRNANPPAEQDVCTMCGKYCAMKGLDDYLK